MQQQENSSCITERLSDPDGLLVLPSIRLTVHLNWLDVKTGATLIWKCPLIALLAGCTLVKAVSFEASADSISP